MSVAFRRESDEEHKEPRFELTIPPGPNLVTAAGLKQAEARVANLKSAVAAETVNEVKASAPAIAASQAVFFAAWMSEWRLFITSVLPRPCN